MNSQSDNEIVIDLADLLRYLWQRKRPLIISMLLGGFLMAVISLTMRNTYQTQVLLAPAQGDSGSFSQLAGQFGGLASLAGIDLGGGSDQLVIEGVAIFTARDFLLGFIRDFNLKPVLFYKAWDPEKERWKESDFVGATIQKLRSLLFQNTSTTRYAVPNEPTDWDTYELFVGEFISIRQDKKTSLITLSVNAYNPEDAVSWARELVRRTNEHLRQNKKMEAEKSIAYLQKALQETNVVEMKNVIYQLIEAQTKTVMLANVKDEFVFKTVDPAYFPEKKYGPKRTLMVLGGAFFCGICVFFYQIIIFLREIRKQSS